jgi:hypothetical protein
LLLFKSLDVKVLDEDAKYSFEQVVFQIGDSCRFIHSTAVQPPLYAHEEAR